MSKEMVKNIQEKIADFKRFSLVLLSLSAFLYIGSIVPFDGKEATDQLVLLSASYTLIGVAILFYRKVAIWKKQLNEER
ncbi:YrhC family protein [Pseudalkalibacillus sp. SCS-8]|uniref:YrhC family protein n=1 Tax=Pseudalkalibacillus nanhaiensis TaxID=3115291 RepID=UPI0032D9C6F3